MYSLMIEFPSPKIISVKKLIEIVKTAKEQGKTSGLCVGSYDLLHPGHMTHFESAKKQCDILIVAVTADSFVKKRKGLNRPIIEEKPRAYAVSQLISVDYVIISPYERATELILELKPSYYIKGSDYINKKTPGITAERQAIKKVHGEMKYTFNEKLSTSSIIKKIKHDQQKPILLIGSGMAAVGKSSILKEVAKKYSFIYIDKDALNESYLRDIQNGKLTDKDAPSNFYKEHIKYQTYHAMLSLAAINLLTGKNVILDGYFSNKFQLNFMKNELKSLSKKYHIIRVYFTCSKAVLFNRMNKRNLPRDIDKIKTFESYYQKHTKNSLIKYDIIQNTEGNIETNADSLYHDIIKRISEES